MRELIEEFIVQAGLEESKPKTKRVIKFDVAKLKEQLRRLNIAYFDGNITDQEYTQMAAKLKENIKKAEETQDEDKGPDLDALKGFLDTDFEDIYLTLEKEDKRRMWRSIIKEIRVENNGVVGVTFNA